jgi:mitochondrial inner membrane protease subunit 2
MPPFSRGAGRICFKFARPSSSTPTSKTPRIARPISRPRKVQKPPVIATETAGAAENPSNGGPLQRLNPLYGFALLRSSIAESSREAFESVRKQYMRLPRPVRRTTSFIYYVGIAFALILPPLMIFRNHFFDIIRVTGSSMSPYLNTSFEDGAADVRDITKSTDRVLLNLYRPVEDLQRGMVVGFRTPHDPEKLAIKRIVAVEGDRVYPLPHYQGIEALGGRGLVVPNGHIWVEGDVSDTHKKNASTDSNIYGPISAGLVLGKATHVITSLVRRWNPIDSDHFKLPDRVEVDAVRVPNLDEEYQTQAYEQIFQTDIPAKTLKLLQERIGDGSLEKYTQDQFLREVLHNIRYQAREELMKTGSQKKNLATELCTVIDGILGEVDGNADNEQ